MLRRQGLTPPGLIPALGYKRLIPADSSAQVGRGADDAQALARLVALLGFVAGLIAEKNAAVGRVAAINAFCHD